MLTYTPSIYNRIYTYKFNQSQCMWYSHAHAEPPIHIRIQIHWIARHVRRKLCSCCIRIQIHCIARHVRRKLCSCCFGWEALRPCFYFEPCHRSVYSMSKRAHSLRCQGSRGRDIDQTSTCCSTDWLLAESKRSALGNREDALADLIETPQPLFSPPPQPPPSRMSKHAHL